jgi:hypothetical protein
VALVIMLAASPGWAQEPRGIEAGLEVVATLADPAFAGGGLSLGVRPGGRARVLVVLTPGVQQGRFAGHGELLGQLMLTPAKRDGVGFYGIAGVAGQVGPRDSGLLVLGLGLEGAPATGSGWHFEAGVGGGVRIAAGWRWRWIHPPASSGP